MVSLFEVKASLLILFAVTRNHTRDDNTLMTSPACKSFLAIMVPSLLTYHFPSASISDQAVPDVIPAATRAPDQISAVDASFFGHIGENTFIESFSDSEDGSDVMDSDSGCQDNEVEYSSDLPSDEGDTQEDI